MNGFYIAYLTGTAGNGMVLLAMRNGAVAGVDTTGVAYDGQLTQKADGSFACSVGYVVPPGAPLITGGMTAAPTRVQFNFDLPPNFSNGVVVQINTPLGLVNATFSKVRELDI